MSSSSSGDSDSESKGSSLNERDGSDDESNNDDDESGDSSEEQLEANSSDSSKQISSPASSNKSNSDDESDHASSDSDSVKMMSPGGVSGSDSESTRMMSPGGGGGSESESTRMMSPGRSDTESIKMMSPGGRSWRSQSQTSRSSLIEEHSSVSGSSIRISLQSPFSPGSPVSPTSTKSVGMLELSEVTNTPQMVALPSSPVLSPGGVLKKQSSVKSIYKGPPSPATEVLPPNEQKSPARGKVNKSLPPPLTIPEIDSSATLVCPSASPSRKANKPLPPPSPTKDVVPKGITRPKRMGSKSPPPRTMNNNIKAAARYMEPKKKIVVQEVEKRRRNPSKIKPSAVHIRLNADAVEIEKKRKQKRDTKEQMEIEETKKVSASAAPEKGKAKTAGLYSLTQVSAEKIITNFALKFKPGIEVRATRLLRPLCVGEQHSRFRDNLVIEEGSTCRILPATSKRLSRTKPKSDLWDENRSESLINGDDSCETSARHIFVWVACQGFEALIRADSIMTSHTPLEQHQISSAIQDYETYGPKFIGKLEAELQLHIQSKDKEWHGVSKRAQPEPVEAIRQSHPKGARVILSDENTNKKQEAIVKGYIQDGKKENIIALKVLLIESERYKKIPMDMLKTVVVKKREKQHVDISHMYEQYGKLQEKLSEKRAIKEVESTMECTFRPKIGNPHTTPVTNTTIEEAVARLNVSTKCMDKNWVETAVKQKEENEIRQIEIDKRHANRTYDALQTWKERWEESHSI